MARSPAGPPEEANLGNTQPEGAPSRSRSSGAGAYELILDAIDSGALPPGTRLREVELAERFHVSRTPVREALKRLEATGLVVHEPHHGAVVAMLDHGQTVELYQVREVLEGAAARLAASQATPEEIEILREMLAQDHARVDDPVALARGNRLFHRQLHLAARNRFLDTMLENMRRSLLLLAGTTLGQPERGPASLAEHGEIVAAIAAHDPDAAEAAARRHIRHAFKARIRLREG